MTTALQARSAASCGHKKPCGACEPRRARVPGHYAGCVVVAYHMACRDMALFGYSQLRDERATRLAIEAAGAGSWSEVKKAS